MELYSGLIAPYWLFVLTVPLFLLSNFCFALSGMWYPLHVAVSFAVIVHINFIQVTVTVQSSLL